MSVLAETLPRNAGFSSFPGLQKAAIVLLILGEERAGRLMENMEQAELTAVIRAMAGIGKIAQQTVTEACQLFSSKLAEGEVMVGSAYTAERMLAKFLPEDRVASIMNEIKAPIGRTTWEKLSSINHVALSKYLAGEGAQTAAVVISRLVPEYAARVIESFQPGFASEVVKRVIDLDAVSRESVVEIEGILQGEFMANYGPGSAGSDPASFLAEIFNRTKGEVAETVLADVGVERPTEVARIQSLMFTFPDLAGIDLTAASAIMNVVPREIMTMALKGATEAVSARFFDAVTDRVANIMRDEIQMMGRQRLRDVKSAQEEVLRVAKRLESAGELMLRATSDDDRMID